MLHYTVRMNDSGTVNTVPAMLQYSPFILEYRSWYSAPLTFYWMESVYGRFSPISTGLCVLEPSPPFTYYGILVFLFPSVPPQMVVFFMPLPPQQILVVLLSGQTPVVFLSPQILLFLELYTGYGIWKTPFHAGLAILYLPFLSPLILLVCSSHSFRR
jgi:hypothetical protein